MRVPDGARDDDLGVGRRLAVRAHHALERQPPRQRQLEARLRRLDAAELVGHEAVRLDPQPRRPPAAEPQDVAPVGVAHRHDGHAAVAAPPRRHACAADRTPQPIDHAPRHTPLAARRRIPGDHAAIVRAARPGAPRMHH